MPRWLKKLVYKHKTWKSKVGSGILNLYSKLLHLISFSRWPLTFLTIFTLNTYIVMNMCEKVKNAHIKLQLILVGKYILHSMGEHSMKCLLANTILSSWNLILYTCCFNGLLHTYDNPQCLWHTNLTNSQIYQHNLFVKNSLSSI